MSARRDNEMELALDLPTRSTNRARRATPAEECTDGELLERIGDGDREAFEILYRRFVRPVFALALRRLGDRGRAEDATQETFTSIWRSASSYRPERGASCRGARRRLDGAGAAGTGRAVMALLARPSRPRRPA
jgi:hypothetical protein